MKIRKAGRAWIAGGAVLSIVAASGAMAAGGGSKLTEHAKTVKAKAGSTATVSARCGKDGRATSTGFEGALRFSSNIANIKEALPVRQTVGGSEGKAGLANVNAKSNVSAYAYCGGPKLSEASKRKTVTGSGSSGSSVRITAITAKCAGDKVAYSGGFKTSFAVDPMIGPRGAIAVGSYRSSKSAWTAEFIAPASGAPARTYVYCANEKALAAHSKTRTITVPAGGSIPTVKTANVTANCKKGETPISGGFRPRRFQLQSGPLTIGSRGSKTGWTSRAAAISSPGAMTSTKASLTSFVYCAE